jgi:integrase
MVHAQWEQDVLEFVRKFVRQESGLDGHVGCARRSLIQNMGTYQRVLQRLGITKANAGVTGHGLRAAFAIRALHRHGLEAPVRGGDLTQLNPAKRELILRAVAEDLGHSRAMISTAYYGSVKQPGGTKKFDQDPDAITEPRMALLLTDLGKELARRVEGKRVLRAYQKQVSEE